MWFEVIGWGGGGITHVYIWEKRALPQPITLKLSTIWCKERNIFMVNLIPRSFFNHSLWDEEDDFWTMSSQPSGLSVSEDNNNVYVEAQVPGVDPNKIEVTFNKGVLWIKAAQEQEEKNEEKKYFRKSASSFSYHVRVPESVNSSDEPEAVCKNGVMKITFKKQPEVQPKKIMVKAE